MNQVPENPNKQSGNSPPRWSTPTANCGRWNFLRSHRGSAGVMSFSIAPLSPSQADDPYLNVPHELKVLPNWVVWKYEMREGKPTKVPYNPKTNSHAKPNDSSTWDTFQEATSAAARFSGIGFMLMGSPYVGLDFDGVIENGKAEPFVADILNRLGNSYTEVTPSGKGIRAFVIGTLPAGGRKFGQGEPKKYGAEIYSGAEGGRYLTVTGDKYSGKDIPTVDLEIPYLLCSHFLDEKFKKLWMGDISDYEGDDSRADLALCGKLAKHFSNDSVKIENAFNQSALGKRQKWQKRPDYRSRTIRKAIGSSSTLLPTANPAPVVTPVQFEVLDLNDFLQKSIPASVSMLGPILKEKSIAELYAWRGVGKTFVSLAMGLAVASGGKFLKWQAPHQKRVLYLDGEMAAYEFQTRLRDLTRGMTIPSDYFFPVNFDSQSSGVLPNIAKTEGQDMIEGIIGDSQAELVIIDNLSCFAQIGDTDDEAWLPIATWLLSLRRQGIACLLNHHANKMGSQRGISRREDAFDVVMKLEHPRGYRTEQGLCCELSFEKTRGFTGKDAVPIDIELSGGSGQAYEWSFSDHQGDLREEIVRLRRQGVTIREIAEELSVHRSKVGRIVKTIPTTKDTATGVEGISKLSGDPVDCEAAVSLSHP